MFDSELLKPQNRCAYTGVEKQKPHQFGSGLRIYECVETGKIRLLSYNSPSEPVSALFLDPLGQKRTYTIKAVYTAPQERRKGKARELLAVARMLIGTVKHSDDLTVTGLAWRDKVECIC